MPTPSGAFLRPDLGMIFEQFNLRDDLGYIAQEVFPIFQTARQTANFSRIKVADLLRDTDLSRAPGSGYARDDYVFDQDNYSTVEYGAEELIDDRERQIYIYSFDIEEVAAQRLSAKVLRQLESKTVSAVQTTSNYVSANQVTIGTTTGWANSPTWDKVATAQPIDDVRTGLNALRTSCGLNPRRAVGVCDWKTYQYLLDSEQILSHIKFSGRDETKKEDITAKQVAQVLGLRDIIVASGMKNTADAGQTATLSTLWDFTMFAILHVAQGNDLRLPCFGRTFSWSGDNSNATGIMEEYRDETRRSQVIRCRSDFHVKVLYTAAGILFSNAVASGAV